MRSNSLSHQDRRASRRLRKNMAKGQLITGEFWEHGSFSQKGRKTPYTCAFPQLPLQVAAGDGTWNYLQWPLLKLQNLGSKIRQRSPCPVVNSCPPCPVTVSLTATSPCFLKASRNGDIPISPSSLCQYITTLLERKFVLISNRNLLWHILRPLHLILSLLMTKEADPPLLQLPFRSV